MAFYSIENGIVCLKRNHNLIPNYNRLNLFLVSRSPVLQYHLDFYLLHLRQLTHPSPFFAIYFAHFSYSHFSVLYFHNLIVSSLYLCTLGLGVAYWWLFIWLCIIYNYVYTSVCNTCHINKKITYLLTYYVNLALYLCMILSDSFRYLFRESVSLFSYMLILV